MSNAWSIYDELIDPISSEVTVADDAVGLRWCRVRSSESGLGIAYSMPEQSRPPLLDVPTHAEAPLHDVAALSKSWNFAEAGIGMAAMNAWYAQEERAAANGFVRSEAQPWGLVFDPYAHAVSGKIVSVIGHFPFAPRSLSTAAELRVLERATRPGDFPDPACEYLLPDSDVVFISSSAFVNKTMPRLLELAKDARTIILGPSTPLSPVLFDHGVDEIIGFVASQPAELSDSLGGLSNSGMFTYGYRVEQARR